MKTVKEVSKLTGISIRTLHYYDEIGLLKPSKVNESGYRYYDGKELGRLQQILLFREMNVPLKQIKNILDNPQVDSKEVLRNQREMLRLQKERLEKIIIALDEMLEGGNSINMEVFNKSDIEALYEGVIQNLTDENKDILMQSYQSMDEFKEEFIKNSLSEEGRKNLDKLIEWYGDKDTAIEVGINSNNPKIVEEYGKKLDDVLHRFVHYINLDVNSDEVTQLMKEYDSISKQLYQMKDVTSFSLDMALEYKNNKVLQENLDKVYGEGSTLFIARAIESFYKR